jgi:molybdopterin/thiamine biosynthesis adenylyltransferase
MTALCNERFLLPAPIGDDDRLSRQLGFFSFWPDDPEARQERLRRATVCVLGVGGLGCQVSYLLAAAGVGRLLLCDHDVVERSNLNRQLLYADADVGQRKVEVAAESLRRSNPAVEVRTTCRAIATSADVRAVCEDASVVVRAIDTPTGVAYTVDDACRAIGVPHVGGGFVETWVLAGPFVSAQGPSLRQMMPLPEIQPATGRKGATFSPLTFWLSSYIAGDVLRYLAGLGSPWLLNRLLLMNGANGSVTAKALVATDGDTKQNR